MNKIRVLYLYYQFPALNLPPLSSSRWFNAFSASCAHSLRSVATWWRSACSRSCTRWRSATPAPPPPTYHETRNSMPRSCELFKSSARDFCHLVVFQEPPIASIRNLFPAVPLFVQSAEYVNIWLYIFLQIYPIFINKSFYFKFEGFFSAFDVSSIHSSSFFQVASLFLIVKKAFSVKITSTFASQPSKSYAKSMHFAL